MDGRKHRPGGVVAVEWMLLYFFPRENVSKEYIVAYHIETDPREREREREREDKASEPTITSKTVTKDFMQNIHFLSICKPKTHVSCLKKRSIFMNLCVQKPGHHEWLTKASTLICV